MRLPKNETDIEITELRKQVAKLQKQNEELIGHLKCMLSATRNLNCTNINDLRPNLGKSERNASQYLRSITPTN